MSKTLFIGDSVTDCYRLIEPPFGDGYVFNIAVSGRLSGEIINVGTSGHRLVDLENRWNTDVLAHQPTLVSVAIGINDTWDSSDSYPYQDAKDFIFLVSGDVNIPKGGYNLVIADLANKKVVNIDDLYGDINTHQAELGPAWTPYTYGK